jgi:HlyD family secretion protein
MDKPRPGVARAKKIRRVLVLLTFLILASAATYSLSKLKPAAPTVERAAVWPDTVKRGPILLDIRGTGTLVPEDFRWIPASRDGLVQKINVRIGDTVSPDTIVAELSNPELIQSMEDTKLQIRAAEADLQNARAGHENALISHQIQIANMENSAKLARMQADTDLELNAKGLISQLNVRRSTLEAENSAAQVGREKQRIEINARSAQAQLAAQEARIDLLRATYELKKRQVEELKIRANVSGVLQQVSIEGGQRIGIGTAIAKVAEPGRLKAQLKVAETQAKDIILGQVASIDTRAGIVPGRVVHIDPAAIQGTVTVDIQLNGELPRGTRPDQSVDGTIEIERLDDVLYVGRPANGQANTTVQMFKILPSGEAIRTRVKIGSVSVNSIQILEGLQVGDEVILSDMSAWDAYDRLQVTKQE